MENKILNLKEFKVEGVTLDYKEKIINIDTRDGRVTLKIKKENNLNSFDYIQWQEEVI